MSFLTDSTYSDFASHDAQIQSVSNAEIDSISPDALSFIESAIAKVKELRFVFEAEGDIVALQTLEDELLVELDLLDSARWNAQHQHSSSACSAILTTEVIQNS